MLAQARIASPSPPVAQPAPGGAFITLGTMGGLITSPERSQPANVLLQGGKAYLIDAGDGAAQQLGKAGIAPGTTSRADVDRYIEDIGQHFKGPTVIANDLERY